MRRLRSLGMIHPQKYPPSLVSGCILSGESTLLRHPRREGTLMHACRFAFFSDNTNTNKYYPSIISMYGVAYSLFYLMCYMHLKEYHVYYQRRVCISVPSRTGCHSKVRVLESARWFQLGGYLQPHLSVRQIPRTGRNNLELIWSISGEIQLGIPNRPDRTDGPIERLTLIVHTYAHAISRTARNLSQISRGKGKVGQNTEADCVPTSVYSSLVGLRTPP